MPLTPTQVALRAVMLEAFKAGFNAGCDHMEPPMGPGFYAKNADEAFEHWLEYRKPAMFPPV
jgi:hypothetical protein